MPQNVLSVPEAFRLTRPYLNPLEPGNPGDPHIPDGGSAAREVDLGPCVVEG